MKGCILNAFNHLKPKKVIFFIRLHLICLQYYIICQNTQHWFIFAGQKLISFISYQGTNIIYLNIEILLKGSISEHLPCLKNKLFIFLKHLFMCTLISVEYLWQKKRNYTWKGNNTVPTSLFEKTKQKNTCIFKGNNCPHLNNCI